MPEPTVRCACGRTMNPDAPRGRGHYRCGCGHRVHITIPAPRSPQCVATHRGEACRLPPTTTEPLPLCEQHYDDTGLKEYHGWICGRPDEVTERVRRLFEERWAEMMAVEYTVFPEPDPDELERLGVVYFIRSRDQVKIGTTVNLLRRISSFSVPHITLLATEPGYKKRERELHLQFAGLRLSRREWFHLQPPLTDYINTIRDQHALPPVTP